jgi:hypothetical protein
VNQIGRYWACAKAFQFTPKEVDEIDQIILDGMLILEEVKNKKEQQAMEKASRR